MKRDAFVPSRSLSDRILEQLVDVEIRLHRVERAVGKLSIAVNKVLRLLAPEGESVMLEDDILDYTPSQDSLDALSPGDLAGADLLDGLLQDKVYALRFLTAEVESFLVGRRGLGSYLLERVRAEERRLNNIELVREQHGDVGLPSPDTIEGERFVLHQQAREEYVERWRDLFLAHTAWRALKSSLSGLERRIRAVGDVG